MTRSQVRQVVAWREPVQWTTCLALWVVFAVAALAPDLALPLGAIAPAGFAAALMRTLVLLTERSPSNATPWVRGLALCADVALLTGLLDITGGPFNPFVVVYAADVWLAAVTLSSAWAIVVGTVAAGAFGWLVVDHLRAGLAEHHRLNDFPTHLFTMLFVGSTIAGLVAHYVNRARAAMARQESQLDAARERAARSERLASLTTMAAGAAHELSTPLSTIAVAARELERTAHGAGGTLGGDLNADVSLIQDAVRRCRAILDGMSGRAVGDVASRVAMTPAAIAELACASLPPERRERLRLEVDGAHHVVAAGAEVSRALSSLLKNAFDASRDEPVSLRTYASGAVTRFEVHDQGHGMTDETRRRAGEPFYTTKPAGEGLGLGLFLARTVVEQLGGSLRFEGNTGTVAILEIPVTGTSVHTP